MNLFFAKKSYKINAKVRYLENMNILVGLALVASHLSHFYDPCLFVDFELGRKSISV